MDSEKDKFIAEFLSSNHDLRSAPIAFKSVMNILKLYEYNLPPEEMKDICSELEKKVDDWFALYQALFDKAQKISPK